MVLEWNEVKRSFYGEVIRDWEDMGKKFKKGRIISLREAKFESDFYYSRMYVIPKTHIKVIEEITA